MDQATIVDLLLRRQGRTFAEEAGIRLADRPQPLYQLLVLATLLSARISAGVATAAARELFAAGYRSPRAMRDAGWQARVDALGRGHYRRYDERTATQLGVGAELCLNRWKGDLRRLREEAHGTANGGSQASSGGSNGGPDGAVVNQLRSLLTEFPGIGPTGADIFLREVQQVWPDLPPIVDRRVAAGAERMGLPANAERLAALVDPSQRAELWSALVRVGMDKDAARDVEQAIENR